MNGEINIMKTISRKQLKAINRKKRLRKAKNMRNNNRRGLTLY